MPNNWARWLLVDVFLLAAGILVFEVVQVQIAIHHGQSPVNALQISQQELWHVLLNPWCFAAYLSILVAFLGDSVRTIVKKRHHGNDLWIATALLTSIVILVFRFIQAR